VPKEAMMANVAAKKKVAKKAKTKRGRPRTKSDAKKAFDANIKRAEYFLDIHEEAHKGRGAPTLVYRELPRGAIVFAVGAVDAYLSELSAEVIVQQLEKGPASGNSKDVLRRVMNDIPTLSIEVALAGSQTARLDRLRDAIAMHFHNNVSNHGAKAVGQTVQRIGDTSATLWSNLASSGHRDAAKEVDKWTEVRHQIVHQGKKPSVGRQAARDFVNLVKELAKELDKLALKA
jgi:hypothetical protein